MEDSETKPGGIIVDVRQIIDVQENLSLRFIASSGGACCTPHFFSLSMVRSSVSVGEEKHKKEQSKTRKSRSFLGLSR